MKRVALRVILVLLAAMFTERHEAKSVSQMKQFTSKLKRLQVVGTRFPHCTTHSL